MKKKYIYSMILVILSFSLVYLYYSNTNNNLKENKTIKSSEDDITMGEIEEIFQKYLDENNINIKFGTQEYFDYIIRQELEPENKDEKLEKHPKYKLIDMYFAEYIVAVQNGDLNNPISISRFKNRTIGNIKNMNRVNGM
ncbi:hypothetical protein [Faecalimicrobium sp. JNUCC 81]